MTHPVRRLLLVLALAALCAGAVAVQAARPRAKAPAKPNLQALQVAVQRHPQDANLRLNYAEALLQSGRRAEAQTQLHNLAVNPSKLTPAQRARLRQLQARANAPKPAGKPTASAKAPKKIAWLSFQEALDTAQREHKRVLVDFMAEWCGWCKKMDQEVYTDKDVIALSRTFVFAKVDGDRQPDLARGYQVDGYPTVIVMDAEGKELHRIVGYKPAPDFLKEVKGVS